MNFVIVVGCVVLMMALTPTESLVKRAALPQSIKRLMKHSYIPRSTPVNRPALFLTSDAKYCEDTDTCLAVGSGFSKDVDVTIKYSPEGEIDDKCQTIHYKRRIDARYVGYLFTTEPLCPTTVPCPFEIKASSVVGIGVLDYNIVVYPDEKLDCEKSVSATPRGHTVACRVPMTEEEVCSTSLTTRFRHKLTGPDKDAFLLVEGSEVKVYARSDYQYGDYNASLLVSRDLELWGFLETSIPLIYTNDTTDNTRLPLVEIGECDTFLGGTCHLACQHDLGDKVKAITWFLEVRVGGVRVELDQFNNKQIIFLRHLSKDDAGNYSCRVDDVTGKSHHSIEEYLHVTDSHSLAGASMDVVSFKVTPYLKALLHNQSKVSRLYFEAVVRHRYKNQFEYSVAELNVPSGTREHGMVVLQGKVASNLETAAVVDIFKNLKSFLMESTFPDAFFDARQSLSGKLVDYNAGNTITEGHGHRFMCEFVSCREHRTFQDFSWRLNGLAINANVPHSPFTIINQVKRSVSELICTEEYVWVVLNITQFKADYLGMYECEMKIAYDGRLLPWSVKGSLEVTNFIAQPRASIYPKQIYTSPGKLLTFQCEATGKKVTFGMEPKPSGGISAQMAGAKMIKSEEIKDDGDSHTVDVSIPAEYPLYVFCTVTNSLGSVESYAEIAMITIDDDSHDEKTCPVDVDLTGITWTSTPPGNSSEMPCPLGYKGLVTRLCNGEGVWLNTSYTKCLRDDLVAVKEKMQVIEQNLAQPTSSFVDSVASSISNSVTNSRPVLSGDVSNIVEMMSTMSKAVKATGTDKPRGSDALVGITALGNFANVTNELLSTDTNVWTNLEDENDHKDKDEDKNEDGTDKETDGQGSVKTATKLLAAMDSLTHSSLIEWAIDDKPIVKDNIAIKRKRLHQLDDIRFPEMTDETSYAQYEEWVLNTKVTAVLPATAFASHTKGKEVSYAIILYKNVDKRFSGKGVVTKENADQADIASEILSFSLNMDSENLSSDLELHFLLPTMEISTMTNNMNNVKCAYLETKKGSDMVWSSKHCRTKVYTAEEVHCFCNHFTNFAVLISPKAAEHKALSIISTVGCWLSLVSLVITVLIYRILWRHVRSDHSILHVCLSSALIVVYLLFLVGIERTGHQIGCFIITMAIHYFLLLVFSIMSAEGIELYLRVVFVFSRKSLGWKLFAPAFLTPLCVVGITVVVTWETGYRSQHFLLFVLFLFYLPSCWLSVESGALWALIGPAVLVILMNLIISVLVMRTMLSTHALMNQENKDKAKAVLKALCVLTPLLGLTWFFGIITVFEDAAVFQYLFAVLNTLQGVFIFMFHCLLSSQVRDAIKLRVRQFRSQHFSDFSSSSTGQSKLRTLSSNSSNTE